LTDVLVDGCWVLVQCTEWAPAFFRWPKSGTAELPEEQKKSAEEAIHRLGTLEGTIERAQTLMGWVKDLKEPFTLIIRDLSALGGQSALEVATALRMVMEQKDRCCPQFRLILADTSEAIYLDRPDRSSLRTLTVQYRLPWFTKEEIRKLAEWSPEGLTGWEGPRAWEPLSLNDEALDCFLAHTGGQPQLVQRLLRGLQRLEPKSSALNKHHVEKQARELRLSPPDNAEFWQKDLDQLLEKESEMARPMRAYVLGQSLGPARFPPPSTERALFIAGWVKTGPDSRWGIASEFHAHLARNVLREFPEDRT